MSGRSAPNRGKKSHRRGFDSVDPRQQSSTNTSNHSGSRYPSREPPPRFLNRQRNGDGRTSGSGETRDYYDDHGRRERGDGKGSGGGRLQQSSGTSGSSSGGGRGSNFG